MSGLGFPIILYLFGNPGAVGLVYKILQHGIACLSPIVGREVVNYADINCFAIGNILRYCCRNNVSALCGDIFVRQVSRLL